MYTCIVPPVINRTCTADPLQLHTISARQLRFVWCSLSVDCLSNVRCLPDAPLDVCQLPVPPDICQTSTMYAPDICYKYTRHLYHISVVEITKFLYLSFVQVQTKSTCLMPFPLVSWKNIVLFISQMLWLPQFRQMGTFPWDNQP